VFSERTTGPLAEGPSSDLYRGWINFSCKPSTVHIIRRKLFSDVAAVSKNFFSVFFVVMRNYKELYY